MQKADRQMVNLVSTSVSAATTIFPRSIIDLRCCSPCQVEKRDYGGQNQKLTVSRSQETYDGARFQEVGLDKSWTSFFGKLLAEAYRQDVETNGVWSGLEIVHRRAQSHLTPRLIGILESEGRTVRPTLIHGDLWDGNVGVDAKTGDPWMVSALQTEVFFIVALLIQYKANVVIGQ